MKFSNFQASERHKAPSLCLLGRVGWRLTLSGLCGLILLSTAACQPQPAIAPTPTPPDVSARVETQIRNGDYQQALYSITWATAQQGWTPAYHLQAARLWRVMGDLRRSLAHYQAANALTEAETLRAWAETALALDEVNAAILPLERLIALNPPDGWAQFQAALILAPTAPDRARTYLQAAMLDTRYSIGGQKVLEALNFANDALLSFRVGAACAEIEEYRCAEHAFQASAQLNSPFPEAVAYVGLMQTMQGKDGGAAISEALRLNPNSSDVWLVRALQLRTQERYEDSLTALFNAYALNDQDAAVYAEIGTTYRLLGRLDLAEFWLQSAVKLSNNDPTLQKALTEFYANTAQIAPQTSLEGLAEQAAAQPNNPEALSAYGWALHRSGDTTAGLAKIEEALKLDPNQPRVLFDKARVLLDVGRTDEAKELLQQVAASDSPYAAEARTILENLP